VDLREFIKMRILGLDLEKYGLEKECWELLNGGSICRISSHDDQAGNRRMPNKIRKELLLPISIQRLICAKHFWFFSQLLLHPVVLPSLAGTLNLETAARPSFL